MNNLIQILLVYTLLQTGEGIGAGSGPTFIGGSDSEQEAAAKVSETYKHYINYKRLIGQTTQEDEEYYQRYNAQCI